MSRRAIWLYIGTAVIWPSAVSNHSMLLYSHISQLLM